MNNLEAQPSWDNVWQWDEKTPLLGGGPDAPLNRQAQALMNRTEQLKEDQQELARQSDSILEHVKRTRVIAPSNGYKKKLVANIPFKYPGYAAYSSVFQQYNCFPQGFTFEPDSNYIYIAIQSNNIFTVAVWDVSQSESPSFVTIFKLSGITVTQEGLGVRWENGVRKLYFRSNANRINYIDITTLPVSGSVISTFVDTGIPTGRNFACYGDMLLVSATAPSIGTGFIDRGSVFIYDKNYKIVDTVNLADAGVIEGVSYEGILAKIQGVAPIPGGYVGSAGGAAGGTEAYAAVGTILWDQSGNVISKNLVPQQAIRDYVSNVLGATPHYCESEGVYADPNGRVFTLVLYINEKNQSGSEAGGVLIFEEFSADENAYDFSSSATIAPVNSYKGGLYPVTYFVDRDTGNRYNAYFNPFTGKAFADWYEICGYMIALNLSEFSYYANSGANIKPKDMVGNDVPTSYGLVTIKNGNNNTFLAECVNPGNGTKRSFFLNYSERTQTEHTRDSIETLANRVDHVDNDRKPDGAAVLEAGAQWSDVPKLNGSNENLQAQALVNRTELLAKMQAEMLRISFKKRIVKRLPIRPPSYTAAVTANGTSYVYPQLCDYDAESGMLYINYAGAGGVGKSYICVFNLSTGAYVRGFMAGVGYTHPTVVKNDGKTYLFLSLGDGNIGAFNVTTLPSEMSQPAPEFTIAQREYLYKAHRNGQWLFCQFDTPVGTGRRVNNWFSAKFDWVTKSFELGQKINFPITSVGDNNIYQNHLPHLQNLTISDGFLYGNFGGNFNAGGLVSPSKYWGVRLFNKSGGAHVVDSLVRPDFALQKLIDNGVTAERIENEGGFIGPDGKFFSLNITLSATGNYGDKTTDGVLILEEFSTSDDAIDFSAGSVSSAILEGDVLWLNKGAFGTSDMYNPVTGEVISTVDDIFDLMLGTDLREVSFYTQNGSTNKVKLPDLTTLPDYSIATCYNGNNGTGYITVRNQHGLLQSYLVQGGSAPRNYTKSTVAFGAGSGSITAGENGLIIGVGSTAQILSSRSSSTTATHYLLRNPNGTVGTIQTENSSTSYNTTSDETLKNFTGPLSFEDAVDIIKADPVRRFDWKSSGESAVGWGAQTSYQVSQDLASPGGWFLEDGTPAQECDEGAIYQPWGVDQSKRTPYLWAVVSGLIDKIEALEQEIASLRNSIK